MSKSIQKSIYGSIALLKGYCNKCKQMAFIIDGELQCCNALVDEIYEKEVVKRESESEKERSYLPFKLRKEALDEQDNKCIYCGQSLEGEVWNEKREKFVKKKIHYDHFVAWVYSGDNHRSNIVASCSICNLIKSDKYFYDLISAKEFIQNERKRKGFV